MSSFGCFKGMLVECDAAMKEYLIWVNEKEGTKFIINSELDETHILIDPSRKEYVKSKMDYLMNQLSFSPLEHEARQEEQNRRYGRK
ncbi:hypothetical protein SARC_04724 [Sphaeroforma arctica JP610]|uniref:General transcription and DNA repair factor IIH subunit TFB5 n=1 Tax=Sphaeroforma arctica JP610 TaxID=667725 RepID=A0A0L0G2E7_9EUKA|nr:hypothetical protein SARC_04724 [Sphaeroforma arctica JP610]KNC83001.1 hypothetical protein SARC_04724 [Sphaeroforma arctica JP610]|eukprot:XP_014156903.1 hypothetical protein SARC_04724 [Sphaeroforma arctica JP610]